MSICVHDVSSSQLVAFYCLLWTEGSRCQAAKGLHWSAHSCSSLHYVICFIVAFQKIPRIYCYSVRTPQRSHGLIGLKQYNNVISCKLRNKHLHKFHWKPSPLPSIDPSPVDPHSSFLLQATQAAPVEILEHLLMLAGRRGTSKCAARCVSPAQWDTHCTAQQRGFAFPTGPGQADSRSANVRNFFQKCLCYLWNKRWFMQEDLTHTRTHTAAHT